MFAHDAVPKALTKSIARIRFMFAFNPCCVPT
jgi:hypothetical protein